MIGLSFPLTYSLYTQETSTEKIVNIPFLLKDIGVTTMKMYEIKKMNDKKKCQVQSSVPLYILVNIY